MAYSSISSRAICQYLFKRANVYNYTTSVQDKACPLMVNEVLQLLDTQDGHKVLDMTFGDGLHTEAILGQNKSVHVIALDRDQCAFQKAQELSLKYPGRVTPLLGRFSDLPALLAPLGIGKNSLDGILFDLGCSTMQLNDPNRGFTPDIDGPLDMRMDGCQGDSAISAHDVLQKTDERDLTKILKIYGSEDRAKMIAKAIISCRYTQQSISSTFQLRDFIRVLCKEKSNKVVRNVFYGLRIFVNNEFNELNHAMVLSDHYLKTGGRVVALTFNQLEDTIVKRHVTGNVMENSPNPLPLKYYSATFNLDPEEINKLRRSRWSPLTKHVVTLSGQEKFKNHHFQMAKLRGARKL